MFNTPNQQMYLSTRQDIVYYTNWFKSCTISGNQLLHLQLLLNFWDIMQTDAQYKNWKLSFLQNKIMKKWGLIFLTEGQTLPTDFYLLTSRLGNALHYWGSSQGCAGEVSLQAEGKQSHRREVSPVEIWTYISSVSLLALSLIHAHTSGISGPLVCAASRQMRTGRLKKEVGVKSCLNADLSLQSNE